MTLRNVEKVYQFCELKNAVFCGTIIYHKNAAQSGDMRGIGL